MKLSTSFLLWLGYNFLNKKRVWIGDDVHSTYLNRQIGNINECIWCGSGHGNGNGNGHGHGHRNGNELDE